jgi:nicotinamide mononucleotide adenylyltransferase
MELGLILGRFQPFHKGHKSGICEQVRLDFEDVSFGVYSPPRSLKNPFKYEEIKDMIVYDFPDADVHKIDASSVISALKSSANIKRKLENGSGEICICSSDPMAYFGATAIRSKGNLYSRNFPGHEISATDIRNRIYVGDKKYRDYVNGACIEIVEREFPDRLNGLDKNGNKWNLFII